MTSAAIHAILLTAITLALVDARPDVTSKETSREEESGFDPASAEYLAISAAAPHIQKKTFSFREDYWTGLISNNSGKAIRIQLFRGNSYHFWFAADQRYSDQGLKLEVKVLDRAGKIVSKPSIQKGPVCSLHLKPKKTGLYLIAMRMVYDGEKPLRCVLFHGFE